MASDPLAIVRAYLAAQPGMVAQFGQRIYAGADLPSGYTPQKGPACLFAARGGGIDYSSKLWKPSLQFRTYAATEMDAWAGFNALFDAFNDKQARWIKWARMDDGTFPTQLNEPEKHWPFILSFFTAVIANG